MVMHMRLMSACLLFSRSSNAARYGTDSSYMDQASPSPIRDIHALQVFHHRLHFFILIQPNPTSPE